MQAHRSILARSIPYFGAYFSFQGGSLSKQEYAHSAEDLSGPLSDEHDGCGPSLSLEADVDEDIAARLLLFVYLQMPKHLAPQRDSKRECYQLAARSLLLDTELPNKALFETLFDNKEAQSVARCHRATAADSSARVVFLAKVQVVVLVVCHCVSLEVDSNPLALCRSWPRGG